MFFPYVHPSPAIHRLANNVNEALFYTGVITLLRDPWGGLALVPLITILFRFAFANLRGYFNCWSEVKHGKHFKGILFIKISSNINNKDLGGIECNTTKHNIYIYI